MLKNFLVFSAVLLVCSHHGLSAPLEEDSDSAGPMCARNGEGCKENDKTDGYSEFNDNGGVYVGTGIISDRNYEIETERGEDVSDELMEDGNRDGKVIY